MALAIDDALNFDASRTHKEQLKLLLDLTNSVVSTLDLRELFAEYFWKSSPSNALRSCGRWAADAESSRHLASLPLDFPESRGFVREESLIPMRELPWHGFKTGEPYVERSAT